MLAARGVSLGLGKINLSELNVLPSDRAFLGKLRREKKAEEAKNKIIIKKHVDKNTLWVACRMVVVGGMTIVVGLLMTIVGYFDKDLTTTLVFNTTLGTTMSIVDDSLRYKLKSMQYIGPILMGSGMFLLIICCVITLESRDKHAQIIQEESSEYRRKSKLSMSATATKTSLLSPTGDDQLLSAKENGQAMGQAAPGTTPISERHTNTIQPQPAAPSLNIVAVKAEVHPQKCMSAILSHPNIQKSDGLRNVYNIVNTRKIALGKAPIVRVESVVELSMATPLSHSGSGSTVASI